MECKELISELRSELDTLEAAGHHQLQVGSLRAYLDAAEKNAGFSQEHRNREQAGLLAHYAAQSEHAVEMLKAVLEAGKSALQALLVINGGAVVALLGVFSNLVGKPDGGVLARYLALPLFLFGVGVLCGALGFSLRYLSQACYSEALTGDVRFTSYADRLRIAAVAVAIGGFVAFGFGVGNAYNAVVWSFEKNPKVERAAPCCSVGRSVTSVSQPRWLTC